ncbi:hypothetical protein ACFFP0_08755 [Rhizobium puerariae]|uniref:Uncharacterized protein n=1 Tax=Rhizobium puerariae TaxID=1585791 RepID=A0ABV6AED9_9HYPH
MAHDTKHRDLKSRMLNVGRHLVRRKNAHEWFACLAGNVAFWLLDATIQQFAIFDLLWSIVFLVRYSSRKEAAPTSWSRPEPSGSHREFIVFLIHVLIACDVATVIVDSFSSNAII